VRHRRAQPGGVDDVVGIDDADESDVGVEMGEAPVEGAGFVPRPLGQVDERHSVAGFDQS
jgi:hypothetical protein